MSATSAATVFIVMGVSGVGKSTVARTLAARIGARYLEADDYHADESRDAMSKGIPLSDEMRLPWLLRLAEVGENTRRDGPVVMACSALKRSYRDLFRARIGKVHFVYLHAEPALIASRISTRTDHFMPPSLLESQLALLEPPSADEDAIDVEVNLPKEAVNDLVERKVRERLSAPAKT